MTDAVSSKRKRKRFVPGSQDSKGRAPSTRRRGPRAAGEDAPRETFDERQKAILDTAERLFVERGYENTSLADLARSLHVTKPAIYHYFDNKEEILRAIFERADAKVSSILHSAIETGIDGLDRLRRFAEGYAAHIATPSGKCLVKVTPWAVSQELKAWAIGRIVYTDSIVLRILVDGIRDGSIRDTDVRMATFSLFGALNWIAFWHHEGGELDPDTIARRVVSVVILGLAADRDEALAWYPADPDTRRESR